MPANNKITSANLFSPQQQQLFQQLMLMLGGGAGGRQPLSLAGLEEFSRQQTGADQAFLSETIDKPLTRNFQEEVLPQISRTFGQGGGFYGSERIRSQERAIQQLGQTIASGRARYTAGKETERFGNALSFDQSRMQLLTQLLGIPQQENIAFQGQGQEGLEQMLMAILGASAGGFAGGYGGGLGAAAAL